MRIKNLTNEHMSKNKRKYIMVVILAIPIIFTLIFSLYVLDGSSSIIQNIKNFKGKLILEPSDFPRLSEVIYYLICTYTLIVTAIFSWAILQSSIESNNLAKEIKNREDNKEYETVRENALIVYYDLFMGIEDLRRLYLSRIINNVSPIPRKIFLSNDWIKNVAILKNDLSRSEINDIYVLYGKLLTISSFLEEGLTTGKYSEGLNEETNRLFSDICLSVLPKSFIKRYDDSAIKLLNNKYFMLLEKLKILTLKKDEFSKAEDKEFGEIGYIKESKLYKGVFDDAFNGNGAYYSENNKLKYQGRFKNGYLYSGTVSDYYENGELIYEFEYKDGEIVRGELRYKDDTNLYENNLCFKGVIVNGKVKDGFIEYYYDNLRVKYRGNIIDGLRNGIGTSYYDSGYTSEKYVGTWVDNCFQEGEFNGYGDSEIVKFEGEYKNGKPFNGQIKYRDSYFKKAIIEFEGEIKEGKPFKGRGRVFYKDYMNRGYREKLWEEESKEEFYFEDYEDNSIEVERELKEMEFKEVKSNYSKWEEYINAEWDNGQLKVMENDIMNKEIIYYEESKIKKS